MEIMSYIPSYWRGTEEERIEIIKKDYEAGNAYKKKCVVCGTEFYAERPEAKYCSGGCSTNAYLTRRKEKKNIERDKICPMCGIGFHAKRKDSLYCSPACKQKAYRQNKNVTDKG